MGDENLVTNSEIHIKDVVKDLYGDTSSEGGDGSSIMEYWKNGDATIPLLVALYCPFAKIIIDGVTDIMPGSIIYTNPESIIILAVAFNRTHRFAINGKMLTMNDLLTELGWDDSNFIQITEEEFYKL